MDDSQPGSIAANVSPSLLDDLPVEAEAEVDETPAEKAERLAEENFEIGNQKTSGPLKAGAAFFYRRADFYAAQADRLARAEQHREQIEQNKLIFKILSNLELSQRYKR